MKRKKIHGRAKWLTKKENSYISHFHSILIICKRTLLYSPFKWSSTRSPSLICFVFFLLRLLSLPLHSKTHYKNIVHLHVRWRWGKKNLLIYWSSFYASTSKRTSQEISFHLNTQSNIKCTPVRNCMFKDHDDVYDYEWNTVHWP